MATYTTVSGDTWDWIAYKVYGDELKAADLITANRHLSATAVFSGEVVLQLPELPLEAAYELPPWRKEG